MTRTMILLALTLHTVLAGAASSVKSPVKPAASAAVDIPDPTRVAPAQLWDDLFTHADYGVVRRGMDLVDSLRRDGDDGREVDPEACRKKRSELDKSLREAPVSLALWFASYNCAQATGDTVRAEHDLQAFHALVKHAFDILPPDNGMTPVRVLSEHDINAFLDASGQQLVFAYYDAAIDQRRLPLMVSLWDEPSQRERVVSFDFLDSVMRLKRNEKTAEFPLFRRVLRSKLLEAMAEKPGTAAASGYAVQKALQQGNLADRIRELKAGADQGHFAPAMALGAVCLLQAKRNCGTDAVDALLPWAEQHVGAAMTMLALAYEDGLGTPRDIEAAKALVRAADQRMGGHRGTLMYASLKSLQPDHALSPVIADTLSELAADANPMAESLIAARAAVANQTLTPTQRAGLEHAAGAGVPLAQALLGATLLMEEKADTAFPWIEKAAAADVAKAQSGLARMYDNGLGIKADPDKALDWYERAGQGGDVDAMLHVAAYWLDQPASAEQRFHAQGWLQSAATLGNTEAMRHLADLYATEEKDLEGGKKEALLILRDLGKRPEEAKTRRQLAKLLLRDASAPAEDRAEARRLLEQDARAGDATSQYEFGTYLLDGSFGKADRSAGMNWLNKAAEKDNDAAVFVAGVVYYGRFGVRRNPVEGISRWRKMAAVNAKWARNNLAWALCTVAEEKFRDPAAGLKVADDMEAAGPVPLAYIDTVAACHAATGDFAGALERSQRILAELETRQPVPEEAIKNAKARIADYTAGRAYVEPIEVVQK